MSGKAVDKLTYDPGQGGKRGRSAIGIKDGRLALYCTPEQLADFAAGVERQEAAKARKEAKEKPAPIARQLRDAQAQAEAERSPAAPRKDAPDRGDR